MIMTKAEFEKYIENISVFERMKENLSTLKMEWETDVTKIDLSVLARSMNPIIPGTQFLIKWVPAEKLQIEFKDFYTDGDTEQYIELYKIIKNGVKIIPPLSIRPINYIDCIPQEFDLAEEIEQSQFISVHDEEGQIKLAKKLKLKEIPILFAKIPYKIYFTKEKWELNCKNEILEFTHKTTREKKVFPLCICSPQYTASGDYLFLINGYLY